MLNCQNCGAQIDPSAAECTYCGTLTAGGIWKKHDEERRQKEQAQAAQAQAHYQATQAQHARFAQERALVSSAHTALIWSVIGLVLCCIPVPAIVALVMALRVRGEAKRLSAPVPSQGTIALVLSLVSVLGFAGLVTKSMLDDRARAARVTELEEKVADDVKDKSLDVDVACTLVEIELLQNGFGDISDSSVERVRCPGELKKRGKKELFLGDVQVDTSGGKKTLVACFKRGNRWAVEQLGHEACGDADATKGATSAASAKASAAPTASAAASGAASASP